MSRSIWQAGWAGALAGLARATIIATGASCESPVGASANDGGTGGAAVAPEGSGGNGAGGLNGSGGGAGVDAAGADGLGGAGDGGTDAARGDGTGGVRDAGSAEPDGPHAFTCGADSCMIGESYCETSHAGQPLFPPSSVCRPFDSSCQVTLDCSCFCGLDASA